MGLKESDFWNMTLIEIERHMKGAEWRFKQQASFDHTLANMIGVSIGRIFSEDSEFPSLHELYPTLFEEELVKEAEEAKRTEQSVNNFMDFALKLNSKLKAKGEDDE